MSGEFREIGVEPDADRLADVEASLEVEAGRARDRATASVGPDQILATNFIFLVIRSIANARGHAFLVLPDVGQFRVEADRRAMPQRGVQYDGLQLVLGDVAHRARTGAIIVRPAVDPGAPSVRPRQLEPGERGRENLRAHQVLRHGVAAQAVLDAEVSKYLDRSLIGDVRALGIGRPGVFRYGEGVHPGSGQPGGRRKPGRSGADHQHVRFQGTHRSSLALL